MTGIIIIFSCNDYESNKEEEKRNKVQSNSEKPYFPEIPPGFPELIIPEDNKLTIARIQLGERLFYDKLLSKDSTISCSSCHKPDYCFADTVAISPGIKGKKGFRNAPSLLNIGFQKSFMMDGGVPTLEIQAVHPLTDTNEMGFGINEAVARLKSDEHYQEQSKKAYDREFDAFVLTRALSAYERILFSTSTYDTDREFEMEYTDDSRKKGKELFFSDRLNCTSCHSGVLFTDFSFQNNGSKKDYTGDNGRERITHKKEDIGKFKVPSLRNVGGTAPYMHDGSFKTLEEVIANYEKGGHPHPNKSDKIKPFKLTKDEKADLIQFLECL